MLADDFGISKDSLRNTLSRHISTSNNIDYPTVKKQKLATKHDSELDNKNTILHNIRSTRHPC
jgi:hypothetical protein